MENLDKSRRRSFVDVRRKSLVFNQIFNDDQLRGCDSPKISIQDYSEALKNEHQQWKDLWHTRKKLSKQIKEKNQLQPLVIKEEDVKSFVSQEDKMFLESKPDYLKMLNNVKKYVDSVSYVDRFKNDIIKHCKGITETVEMQRKIIVDKMCSDDWCEICNMKECSNSDHMFPRP